MKGRGCACGRLKGDAIEVLKAMPEQSVHCCVTSPPYWGLRDYGVDGQLEPESTPDEYVEKMVEVFQEGQVLRDDIGTMAESEIATPGAAKEHGTTRKCKREVYVQTKTAHNAN